MTVCKHPAVTVHVEYVRTFAANSLAGGSTPRTHVHPERLGALRSSGYWGRAHIYVRCQDCGHEDGYTSADWRVMPKWLVRHWQALVGAGGLPAEINAHYRMFERADATGGHAAAGHVTGGHASEGHVTGGHASEGGA